MYVSRTLNFIPHKDSEAIIGKLFISGELSSESEYSMFIVVSREVNDCGKDSERAFSSIVYKVYYPLAEKFVEWSQHDINIVLSDKLSYIEL